MSSYPVPGLPLLPGNNFRNPSQQSYPHKKYFEYVNGSAVAQRDPDGVPVSARTKDNGATNVSLGDQGGADDSLSRQPSAATRPASNSNTATTGILGRTDVKPVLRWFGFWKEEVPAGVSQQDAFRIRKRVVLIYTEDNTIQVSEPREQNSGLDQGQIVKRTNIPRSNGKGDDDLLGPQDFQRGGVVTMFGQTINIIDCDKFTESFYQERGWDLGESSSEIPEDPYLTARSSKHAAPSKKTDLSYRKFLAYDRVTLRFHAVWDDRSSLFGEVRRFTVYYFLADDTVEITEVLAENSGRGHAKTFLKRQKVPNPETGAHLSESDLMVGNTVKIFGRDFLLYDADNFTKAFYQDRFGIQEFPVVDTGITNEQQEVIQEIPPPTGFGSEEDSLSSCLFVVPRPPKKNVEKLMALEGKKLRYRARLVSDIPDDAGRTFVLTFFLQDDTIAIFESDQQSGMATGLSGKFLERSKIKIPGSNHYYTMEHMRKGHTLQIFGHKFYLEDADQFTKDYLSARGINLDA